MFRTLLSFDLDVEMLAGFAAASRHDLVLGGGEDCSCSWWGAGIVFITDDFMRFILFSNSRDFARLVKTLRDFSFKNLIYFPLGGEE